MMTVLAKADAVNMTTLPALKEGLYTHARTRTHTHTVNGVLVL